MIFHVVWLLYSIASPSSKQKTTNNSTINAKIRSETYDINKRRQKKNCTFKIQRISRNNSRNKWISSSTTIADNLSINISLFLRTYSHFDLFVYYWETFQLHRIQIIRLTHRWKKTRILRLRWCMILQIHNIYLRKKWMGSKVF